MFPFAHHELLESVDILGLNPRTPLEHVVAFLVYAVAPALIVCGSLVVRHYLGRHRPAVGDVRGPSIGDLS